MFEISSYTKHTDFTFNSMKDYVCTVLHANNLDAMIDWLNDTQNEKSIGGRDIRNMNFFFCSCINQVSRFLSRWSHEAQHSCYREPCHSYKTA